MKLACCLVALAAWVGALQAQTVYRCGPPEKPVYGQAPCDDGKAIDVNDGRTPEQRALAEAAARRQAGMARELEKQRLKDEAAAEKRAAAERKAARARAAASAAHKASAARPPMVIHLKPPKHGKGDKDDDKTRPFGVPVPSTGASARK